MTGPVPPTDPPDPEQFAVIGLTPFWRWAVVPASLARSQPAIPFYRLYAAQTLARELAESGKFHSAVLLLRKSWWTRRIEVVAREVADA